jgi:hypothetical protein
MLLKSANNIDLPDLLMVNERLFMYMRNNNESSTEPCGTPCFTYSHLENNLLRLLSFIDIL